MFSDAELASGDGLQTRAWGPALWHSLHAIAAGYVVSPAPVAKRKAYAAYLLALADVLPCGACRRNYPRNLLETVCEHESIGPRLAQTRPFWKARAFEGREQLFEFLWRLHSNVSRAIGKHGYRPPDLGQLRQQYETMRARCYTTTTPGKEGGCTQPVAGAKTQCRVQLVPLDETCAAGNIHFDPRCGKQ